MRDRTRTRHTGEGTYGKSRTAPEPVARICQLIRASREAAPADGIQRLRLHVQQPAHRRAPLGALQTRLRRTCVVGRDEVQRRESAIRRSAERLAQWRLPVSAFVRLGFILSLLYAYRA